MRLLLLALISFALFSCQHSPKKNYYLLTAPVVQSSQQTTPQVNNLIGIGPIDVADYLDRLHIIYQTDDNSVVVADNDYWAEPLAKGIPRVIALNLSQRDSSRTFVTFPWRTDSAPHYSIRLNIHSMSRTATDANINATWEIFDNTKKVNVERHYFNQSSPAKNDAKSLTKAYSDLFLKMSGDIDEALTRLK